MIFNYKAVLIKYTEFMEKNQEHSNTLDADYLVIASLKFLLISHFLLKCFKLTRIKALDLML